MTEKRTFEEFVELIERLEEELAENGHTSSAAAAGLLVNALKDEARRPAPPPSDSDCLDCARQGIIWVEGTAHTCRFCNGTGSIIPA